MKFSVYLHHARQGLWMLLFAGLLLACTREQVEKEVPVAGYGEPTWNPLYVLQESLRLDNVPAQSRRTLDVPAMNLQPADTLVFLGDVRELSVEQEDALLEWVRGGGHLLMQVPQWLPVYKGSLILQKLGVDVSQTDTRCHLYQNQRLLCSGNRFTLSNPSRALLYWSDKHDKTAVWARVPYGIGTVDIVGSLDFLNNSDFPGKPWLGHGLKSAEHRALARQMLAPNYGQGTIHLVFAQDIPSLWKWLWQQGWPVWLPLTLALAGGLWQGSQRFGSLLPAPVAQRRSLLEHVRASGYYLYRRRQSALLYQAVRSIFMQRLQQRVPWIASQTGDAQVQAIARHLHYSSEHVRTALSLPTMGDKAALHARIALLIEMRNQL